MKISSLFVALSFTLVAANSVFASQMTSDTESIVADYSVSPAFSVTVPAEIIFSNLSPSISESVSANNILINEGELLRISMQSAKGRLENTSASYIPYSFKINDITTQISASTEYELLKIYAGDKDGAMANLMFFAGNFDNVSLAGLHSDTLTFKVEVMVAPKLLFMQDIAAIKNTMSVGDQMQLADKGDSNKLYWVGKLADGNIWMTQNLDNRAKATTIGADIYYADGIASTGSALSDVPEDSELRHYAGGSYYTWNDAQTACPSGWSLPSKADFENLISLSVISRNNVSSSPFYGARTGDGKQSYIGQYGYLWTSTEIASTTANRLCFGQNSLSVGGILKSSHYSIRCVAK